MNFHRYAERKPRAGQLCIIRYGDGTMPEIGRYETFPVPRFFNGERGKFWQNPWDWCEAPEPIKFDGARLQQDTPAPFEVEPLYYLQDTRSFVGNCPLWWREGGNGYTTDLRQAGKFTFERATRQMESRETDVPWLCQEIDAIERRTVDMQDMRDYRRQRGAMRCKATIRNKEKAK